MSLTDLDWQIRAFIYQDWIDKGQAPTNSDLATQFAIMTDEVQSSLERLDAAHHLFLDPQTRQIRMANPLSAVKTDYRVKVGDNWLDANCAWDTLGIAAMLKKDATVEARLPISREKVTYHVKSGDLIAPDGLLVHFSLPVASWYDNLIHT